MQQINCKRVCHSNARHTLLLYTKTFIQYYKSFNVTLG